MRIGGVGEWCNNANYRYLFPLYALAQRGHDVVYATEGAGADFVSRPERLRGCDVVYAYRRLEPHELKGVLDAVERGAALVWDTDDDLATVPRESPGYRRVGGLRGQRAFAETVRLARRADVVTTSTAPLAERYREAGVERVEVIGNYLAPGAANASRRGHDGVVVGWTASREHVAELSRIPITDALGRLLDAHRDVRVMSLGVKLDLPADRYVHHHEVEFATLPEYVGGWDVGIAPLSDIPFNRTRSDVKLKEYAAAGTPWLASPIGPYAGFGEAQGGRLVEDDGWFDALDAMVRGRFARRRLGRKARAWAKTQTIDAAVDRWEAVLTEAVQRRAAR